MSLGRVSPAAAPGAALLPRSPRPRPAPRRCGWAAVPEAAVTSHRVAGRCGRPRCQAMTNGLAAPQPPGPRHKGGVTSGRAGPPSPGAQSELCRRALSPLPPPRPCARLRPLPQQRSGAIWGGGARPCGMARLGTPCSALLPPAVTSHRMAPCGSPWRGECVGLGGDFGVMGTWQWDSEDQGDAGGTNAGQGGTSKGPPGTRPPPTPPARWHAVGTRGRGHQRGLGWGSGRSEH